MRAYVATTGTIFGFLVVLHVWRLLAAEPGLARDPHGLGGGSGAPR